MPTSAGSRLFVSMLMCCRRCSEKRVRSMSCGLPSDSAAMRSASATAVPLSEGCGESWPEPGWTGSGQPSPRLLGGGGDTSQADTRHTNGLSSSCSSEVGHASLHQSSVGKAVPGKGSSDLSMHAPTSAGATEPPEGDTTDKQHTDSGQHNILLSKAEAGKSSSNGQIGQDPGSGQELCKELQRERSLGSASVASSATSFDTRLYEGLDSLQGEPSIMEDLSSESEQDAAVAAERLRLGDFDVKVRRLGREM